MDGQTDPISPISFISSIYLEKHRQSSGHPEFYQNLPVLDGLILVTSILSDVVT